VLDTLFGDDGGETLTDTGVHRPSYAAYLQRQGALLVRLLGAGAGWHVAAGDAVQHGALLPSLDNHHVRSPALCGLPTTQATSSSNFSSCCHSYALTSSKAAEAGSKWGYTGMVIVSMQSLAL